eukprot:tig00021127_g18743.t1
MRQGGQQPAAVRSLLLCAVVQRACAALIPYTPAPRVTLVIGNSTTATANAAGNGLNVRLLQASQIDYCSRDDRLYFTQFDTSTTIFAAGAFPPYPVGPAITGFGSAGIAFDPLCNAYIAEFSMGRIFRLDYPLTGSPVQLASGLNSPSALAFDGRRQRVWFTGSAGLQSVRRRRPRPRPRRPRRGRRGGGAGGGGGGAVAVADGMPLAGSGLALDEARDRLYVFDGGNSRVLLYSLAAGGGLQPFCGVFQGWGASDGPCASAYFKQPKHGVVVPGLDALFLVDPYDAYLRAILLATNETRTVAGCGAAVAGPDGVGTGVCLGTSYDVAYHPTAGALFLTDTAGLVRRVEVAGAGAVIRLSGGASLHVDGATVLLG